MTLVVDRVSKVYSGTGDPVRALHEVTFDAQPGEVIGVVGPNGAGKSTLLQVITGVVTPTDGMVRRPASVSSLLEVGSGLHPDLTGSENLEAAMATARLTRAIPKGARDQVVVFAGLEEALDVPLKHYSDGMVSRLVCSLAVQGHPQLLIVDEALAIGDASFQRKMLQRVGELAMEGSIVLMTTHSVDLARQAPRCIWLREGRLHLDGPADQVLEEYEVTSGIGRRYAERPGGRFLELRLHPESVDVGGRLQVVAKVELDTPTTDLSVRIEFRAVQGSEPWMRGSEEPLLMRDLGLVAATSRHRLGSNRRGALHLEAVIPGVPITPTTLEVTIALLDDSGRIHDELATALTVKGEPARPSFLMSVTDLTPGD